MFSTTTYLLEVYVIGCIFARAAVKSTILKEWRSLLQEIYCQGFIKWGGGGGGDTSPPSPSLLSSSLHICNNINCQFVLECLVIVKVNIVQYR